MSQKLDSCGSGCRHLRGYECIICEEKKTLTKLNNIMGRQLSLTPTLTEQIQDWAESFRNDPDVEKALLKTNKAAARRVRKKIMEVVHLATPARKELLNIRKS